MSADRNSGDSYAPGAEGSPEVEQPTYFNYDTSEFAAAAPAPEPTAPVEEEYDYLKLAMEELGMGVETPQPAAAAPVQPAVQSQPAAPAAPAVPVPAQPVAPAPVETPAPQPAPQADVPVNPLVAARANAAGAASSGANGLYPISDVDSEKGQRSFDTSFGEKKSHKGLVALIVILLLALAAAAFFGYRYLQTRDATAHLSAAIERLRDSDEVIVPLDQAIATEIETGLTAEELADLMNLSTTTSAILDDTEAKANDMGSLASYLDDDASNALEAVKNSVKARRSMIEVGKMLLSADTKAGTALENLNAAYASIATANERVQWALDSYNGYWNASNNGEDVSGWDLWGIAGLENEAMSYIQSAQASVAAAREAMPEADLTALDQYLSARANHIDLLVQIDTALANGDFDTVWGLGDAVNQADAAQAEASASVPQEAGSLLASAYASMTESQREAYETARGACVAADSVVNGYLGVDTSTLQSGQDAASV